MTSYSANPPATVLSGGASPNPIPEENENIGPDIAAAIGDPSAEVRLATAQTLFEFLSDRHPRQSELDQTDEEPAVQTSSSGLLDRIADLLSGLAPKAAGSPAAPAPGSPAPKPGGPPVPAVAPADQTRPGSPEEAAGVKDTSWDRWLIAERAGKDRPKWLAGLVAPLTAMLGDKDAASAWPRPGFWWSSVASRR